MDIERLTTKYTGHRIGDDALAAAHRRGGIAAALTGALERAAYTLDDAETDLADITASITHHTSTVIGVITANPDDTVPTLNPLGELQAQGPRFDAVIAVRADRITHLRTLVQLWQQLPDDTSVQ